MNVKKLKELWEKIRMKNLPETNRLCCYFGGILLVIGFLGAFLCDNILNVLWDFLALKYPLITVGGIIFVLAYFKIPQKLRQKKELRRQEAIADIIGEFGFDSNDAVEVLYNPNPLDDSDIIKIISSWERTDGIFYIAELDENKQEEPVVYVTRWTSEDSSHRFRCNDLLEFARFFTPVVFGERAKSRPVFETAEKSEENLTGEDIEAAFEEKYGESEAYQAQEQNTDADV